MKYYVDRGADVNAKGFNIKQDKKLLIYASENNPFEILKYPFGYGYDGADVNVKEYLNRTPLTIASYNGHFEKVKYLVENGADVNAKLDYGRTALISACEKGYLEIVKYLVEHGSNVNSKYDYRWTALMFASILVI